MRHWMRLCEGLIAYHGTGSRITQFYPQSVTPHYFTQDKEYAKGYVGGKTPISRIEKPKKAKNYLLTVELNITHMFDTKHDAEALEYYNTQFLPTINAIHAKYQQPSIPTLTTGKYVSFVYADALYRYFMRYPSDYDGMLVDEGSFTSPAIVPFQASQIKILKREIVKLSEAIQPTSLEKIVNAAARLGVELDVWEDDERIDLHRIDRKEGKPGTGAQVIQLLCDYADRTNRLILLQPENLDLVPYYAQWGFDYIDADELEDYYPDWDDMMVRHPTVK